MSYFIEVYGEMAYRKELTTDEARKLAETFADRVGTTRALIVRDARDRCWVWMQS